MIRRHLINLALAFVYWIDGLAMSAGERLKAMRLALPRKRRPF